MRVSSLGKGRTVVVGFLMLIVSLLTYGCGGGGGGSVNTNPSDQVSYTRAVVPQTYQTVSPDGTTRVPITLYVYNRNGHILGGGSISVSVSPNIGQMNTYGCENKGVNTFYYTVPDYNTIQKSGVDHVTITFTVTTYTSKYSNDNSTSASTSVVIYFKNVPSSISAVIPDNDTIMQADGKTVVPVTVYAYGGRNLTRGTYLPDIAVYAKAVPNLGSFDSAVKTTDQNGIATFNYTVPSKDDLLKAGVRSVRLVFTDSTGKISSGVNITFANVGVGNGIPSAVILKALPDTIFTTNVNGGTHESMITAYVVDSAGFPINPSDHFPAEPSNYLVKFSLENAPAGTKLLSDNSSIFNGYAYTSIQSGESAGTAILDADVYELTSTGCIGSLVTSASIPIHINGGQPGSINLVYGNKVTADDTNGTRSISVYAYVENSQGDPVADGTEVNFSVSDNCGGWITGLTETSNGVATATLTYPSQCIWQEFTLTANTGDLNTTANGYYPAKDPVILSIESPQTVSPSGDNVTVAFTLKDENGNGLPLANYFVQFYSNTDNVTITPNPALLSQYGTGSVTVSIPEYDCDNTTNSSGTNSREITITGQIGPVINSVTISQDCKQQ